MVLDVGSKPVELNAIDYISLRQKKNGLGNGGDRMKAQQRWGWATIAFGIGLLIGSFLSLQFLLILVALSIIAIGFLMLRCC